MRKRIGSFLLALCMTAGLLPLTVPRAEAAQYEQAWWPAQRMYVVQIAYESGSGASHKDYNTIDIDDTSDVPEKERKIFAPFTGIVVFKDDDFGYVLLQSRDKVRYANGTEDYMTVGFMHDNDISNITLGTVIKQGQDFYDRGVKAYGKLQNGENDTEKWNDHVQISVFKGQFFQVEAQKNGTYKIGRQLGTFPNGKLSAGNVYAFDAFSVNTGKTKTNQYTEVGFLHTGHTVSKKDAPTDWAGKWKDLNGKPFPAAPTLSGGNNPGKLTKGKSFSIQGTVSAKTKIISVEAGVYTAESGGTRKTGKTVTPSTEEQLPKGTKRVKSYKLTSLASSVKFQTLPEGTYWYRVTVKTGAGTFILKNTQFTVSKPASSSTTSTKPATPSSGNTDPGNTSGGTSTKPSGGTNNNNSNTNTNTKPSGNTNNNSTNTKPSGNTNNNNNTNTNTRPSNNTNTDPGKNSGDSGSTAGTTLKPYYPYPGWYTMAPACAPGLRLDVAYSGLSDGDQVWTWEANDTPAQLWYLSPNASTDRFYNLYAGVDVSYNFVLDVQYGGLDSGTPVWQYTANGSPAQDWMFVDAGGGYLYIVPRENQNLTLAVKNGSSQEQGSIVIETRNGSSGQKWRLTRVS